MLDVRFISSPNRRFTRFTAPGRYTKSPLFLSYIEKPTMSEGSTSGVNCTRLNDSPTARLSATESVVLPTPGTSSSSTCPSANSAIISFFITSRLPATAFSTSISTFSSCEFIEANSSAKAFI